MVSSAGQRTACKPQKDEHSHGRAATCLQDEQAEDPHTHFFAMHAPQPPHAQKMQPSGGLGFGENPRSGFVPPDPLQPKPTS